MTRSCCRKLAGRGSIRVCVLQYYPAQPTCCSSFSSLRRLLQTLPGVLKAWPKWLRSTASSQPLLAALWPICNRNTCSARHNTTHTHARSSEIRITILSEHSAALKYTNAAQRLESTLVAPYDGLSLLKQRKQVSRQSILTQISLKSSIRSYGTKHTRILPRPANLLQQLLVT